MNRRIVALTACSLTVLLTACGGSGSAGKIDNNTPQIGAANPVNTVDLRAPDSFNWSSEASVILQLSLHDINGDAAANKLVSVYELPRTAASDSHREPSDVELEQAAELFTGYTDANGLIDATIMAPGHALESGHVYVKTKLSGVSSTAVVPLTKLREGNATASWVFGPPSIATEMPSPIDPHRLDGEYEFEQQLMQRSASDGNYYLQPFSSYYHWYYGHMPAATWGPACDVANDPAGTLCRSTLNKDEIEKVAAIVQEGVQPPDKYLNASSEQTNLIFNKPAKVVVSFLQESAGYRNTLGFFTYNSNNVPTDAQTLDSARILFPNTSYRGSGGYMYSGDSVSLGEIDPSVGNDAIGFYLAANGWAYNRGQGTEGQYFYSLENLNPEEDKSDAKHMILIGNEVNDANNTRRLWLAVEDIRLDSGTSDRDYNDLVVQIDVHPADALVFGETIPDTTDNDNTVSDADNDGVLAADDIDDNDPDRAFVRYYPAEKSWATLLAEDNWPRLGDFDMNDMVVRYQVKEVVDSQKRVKDISINYKLEARGAAFHNGFAVSFGENVFADNIESASMNGTAVNPLADPAALAYEIFPDAWDFTPRGNENCWTYNTVSDCENKDASNFVLELTFANPVATDSMLAPPYNPFLFAHKTEEGTRGYTRFDTFDPTIYVANGEVKDIEIHMPNKQPTQGQDVSMFGLADDASNGVDRFYVSQNNLPWILNVPYQVRYPEEYVDISVAYPDFANWVASGGVDNRDWYLQPAEEALVYDATNNASDDVDVGDDTEVVVTLPSSDNLSLYANADGSNKDKNTHYKYVTDGDINSVWAPKETTGRISVKWSGQGETVNTVVIRETAGYEGRIGDWRLLDHKTGYELARGYGLANGGTGIGVIEFEATTVKKLSFYIDSASDQPVISEFETYNEGS